MDKKGILIILEFMFILITMFSIVSIIIPGSVEHGAYSDLEYYFVYTKFLRFGFLGVISGIMVLAIGNERRQCE